MKFILKFLLVLFCALALPALASAQVDINHADAKTLAESMSGIGLVKAEAIVAYRDANGPFKSADDLIKVKGIGRKTVEANRSDIVIVTPQRDARQDTDAGRGSGSGQPPLSAR